MQFKINEFSHEQWDEFYSWYLKNSKTTYNASSNNYKLLKSKYQWLYYLFPQKGKFINIKLFHMLFCEYFIIV